MGGLVKSVGKAIGSVAKSTVGRFFGDGGGAIKVFMPRQSESSGGLLKSITPLILGAAGVSLFSPTMRRMLVGSNPKIKQVGPLIPKPGKYEEALIRFLYPRAKRYMYYAERPQEEIPGLYLSTVGRLNRIAGGDLPPGLIRAVNRFFVEQTGPILNQMAGRGVINSTITQRALSGALNRALDLQFSYLPTAADIAQRPLLTALTTQKELMEMPVNLYSMLYSGRHGVQGQPILVPGSGGLLGSFIGGLGSIIGRRIGEKVF